MKYLLDTNVCIKILKGTSQGISRRISRCNNNDVVIPSIVRFELFYGAYKSKKKEATLEILRDFLSCFDDISFDGVTSDLCGRVRAELEMAGTPIGPYDLQIGSIALLNKFVLVTNNTKEFSRIKDLLIEDWE